MDKGHQESGAIDIKTSLETIVGSAGAVEESYGGFTITIVDSASFPWHDVLSFLLGLSFDIWISKEDSTLIIKAKQKLP